MLPLFHNGRFCEVTCSRHRHLIITIRDPCSPIHRRRLVLSNFPWVSSMWSYRCELRCCNSACRKSTPRRCKANHGEGERAPLWGVSLRNVRTETEGNCSRMAAEHHRLPARPRTEPSESNPLLNTPSRFFCSSVERSCWGERLTSSSWI